MITHCTRYTLVTPPSQVHTEPATPSRREGPTTERMAELHIVGEIVGAADYDLPSIFCKYSIEAGGNFRVLQGQPSGQTHCDMPPVCSGGPAAV